MATFRDDLSRRAALGAILAGGCGLTTACAGAGISIGGVELNRSDIDAVGNLVQSFRMSEEDEIELGRTTYGPLIDQSGGRYANRSVQAEMDRFAAAVFETTSRPALPWTATVIDNDEPNAWVLPGGMVGVNKGLLRYVDNEHELAAVVAHEMGHAEESHAISELRRQSMADVTARAAGKGADFAIDGAAGEIAGMAVEQVARGFATFAVFGYSRGAELEADQHILTVFDRTGHDPNKGAQFYETLLELIPTSVDKDFSTSLFAGHPETRKRLAQLREEAEGKSGRATGPGRDMFASLKQTFPTRDHYRRNPSAT